MLSRLIRSTAAATVACWALAAVAVHLLRTPVDGFLFDDAVYWAGAMALVTGGDVTDAGFLDIRGVLTPLGNAPAALLHSELGLDAGTAVLAQNAVLIAGIGAVLVPAIVRRLVGWHPAQVPVSTALVSVTLAGFAPYPFMDLPALVLLGGGLVAMTTRRWWACAPGGALLAAAFVSRPAYALPVVLVVGTVAALSWRGWPALRSAALTALGAGAVLAVQVAQGWREGGVVSVLPPDAGRIADVQVSYAAYGVRYDTVVAEGVDPRLWHCSPAMAQATGLEPPTSNGELLSLFLSTLPDSAVLALHKVTGMLQWSWATPRAEPGNQALLPLGLLVTALTCAGLAALVTLLLVDRPGAHPSRTTTAGALLALTVGVTVTVVGSAPEARFAAPLLVVGIAGCVATLGAWRRPEREHDRLDTIGAVAALALTAVVAFVGAQALEHQHPPGDVNAQTCSQV